MNRRRQPHRIPPPISNGLESLDAEVVLHDFPDDVGLVLWKTVRSVRLWAELSEEQRPAVFGRDAYRLRIERLRALPIDPDVRESLETAAMVLRGVDVHVEAVVTSLRLVAAWADREGALGTALEFTQAAALLTPMDAELVHTVARIARRRGEFARAESWYRQAINVSRRTHDWISLAGAYLGLGGTFLRRGNLSMARQTLIRGARAAQRHSLREERGMLSHHLALLAMRTERPVEAAKYARAALDAYGSDHARVPALALDLACFWAASGYLAEAREILERIPAETLSSQERLARAAALARTAAADGARVEYEGALQDALAALADGASENDAGQALLDLATAAASAHDEPRLREMAERALRVAEMKGEAARTAEAERLLNGPLARPEARRKASRETKRLASDLAEAVALTRRGAPAVPSAVAV